MKKSFIFTWLMGTKNRESVIDWCKKEGKGFMKSSKKNTLRDYLELKDEVKPAQVETSTEDGDSEDENDETHEIAP